MTDPTRKTFGAWLTSQKGRQDAVGAIARHWDSIKGDYQRMRAMPSIEGVLRERGDLAEGSQIAPMWAAAKAEYENGPQQADSPVQPVPGPDQAAGGPVEQPGSYAAGETIHHQALPPGHYPAQVQPHTTIHPERDRDLLELLNAKIDWLQYALISPPGTTFPPWPGEPQVQQEWTWDQLHQYADHEAVEE